MEEKTKKQEQDIKEITGWDKFFCSIIAPFNGNCLILLDVKNNKISVEAVASTFDSLSFVLRAKKEAEYIG
jgi:hypothetical protein